MHHKVCQFDRFAEIHCPPWIVLWFAFPEITETKTNISLSNQIGFMQDCSNHSVLAMELLQSYTKPSINIITRTIFAYLIIIWWSGTL